MFPSYEYFSESDIANGDIHAESGGKLQPWRSDANGVQWFRRRKRGVAATPQTYPDEIVIGVAGESANFCGITRRDFVEAGDGLLVIRGAEAEDIDGNVLAMSDSELEEGDDDE